MTTTIKFSHDGGSSFASRTIPNQQFGAAGVLSPGADAAVIVDNGNLRRTTDSGATWHTVEQLAGPGGALDYGFTSSDAGFRRVQRRPDAHDVRRRRDLDAVTLP